MLNTCLLEIFHEIFHTIMLATQTRNVSGATSSAQAFRTWDASQLRISSCMPGCSSCDSPVLLPIIFGWFGVIYYCLLVLLLKGIHIAALILQEIFHDICHAIKLAAQRKSLASLHLTQAFNTWYASQLRNLECVCPDAPFAIDPPVYPIRLLILLSYS